MKKILLVIILACPIDLVFAQGPLAAIYNNTARSLETIVPDPSGNYRITGDFALSKNISGNTNHAAYGGNKISSVPVGRNTSYYKNSDFTNAVKKGNDHDSLRHIESIAPLLKALQDLTATLEAQQQEIKALKKQLESSKAAVATIADSTNLKGIALYQNNPVPPSIETEIKISLPKETDNANLIFYTREGKQLKILHLFNRGDFKVKVDSRELGMGTCFYALMVDGKIIDSKRLLVRRKS